MRHLSWIASVAYTALLFAALATATAPSAEAACVVGVEPSDTLRIRARPSPRAAERARIPHNACGIRITGPCRRGWCPVAFQGATGWSSGRYLEKKPAANRNARSPKTNPPAKMSGLCVTGLGADGVLQIRSGPGARYVALYGFRMGTCGISITGGCRGIYCPVQYQEYRGWADRRNLQ